MYINWENEQGNLREVTAVYDRILGIPTQLYSHHFQRYGERSFIWNIFGYLGDQFIILIIIVYFEMLYRILIDETNFLETFFPVFYEMFNNLLVFVVYFNPRYLRAVMKWENKFNKWLFEYWIYMVLDKC